MDPRFSLVAGGDTRAAGEELCPGNSRGPVPFSAPSEGRELRPSPEQHPTLSELFPQSPRDAGWTGFVLAQLRAGKPLLWVQERMAILQGGRVHAAGLGPLAGELIHVEARDAKAVLWAMEEGLRCEGLSGVVGEIWGDPQALDFTATRRLAVAAERHGVACWLIRPGGHVSLSGARERWRLASAPSEAHPFDHKAPGSPRWQAELFRSRRRAPGVWLLSPLPSGEREGPAAAGSGRVRGVPASSSLLPQGERGFEPAPLLPVAAAPANRALGKPVRRTG